MSLAAPRAHTEASGPAHAHPGEEAAAWVAGRAVAVSELERRLAKLRASDRACVLPASGTREARQLRRWMAQVMVVEQLCVDELARRGVDWSDDEPPGMPSRTDAVALGSIAAAAWSGHPAVRRAALEVTRDVRLGQAAVESAQRFGQTEDGGLAWSLDELLASARLDAFSRWLARVQHERVTLVPGLEHPGDSSQPDNLHRH